MTRSLYQVPYFELSCALKHELPHHVFESARRQSVSERVILQFMCVGYTVLTSPKKDETAVHCCGPAVSVLVMLVSRNVFHVVSALQSIVLIYKA